MNVVDHYEIVAKNVDVIRYVSWNRICISSFPLRT